jgi:hypothetical protein
LLVLVCTGKSSSADSIDFNEGVDTSNPSVGSADYRLSVHIVDADDPFAALPVDTWLLPICTHTQTHAHAQMQASASASAAATSAATGPRTATPTFAQSMPTPTNTHTPCTQTTIPVRAHTPTLMTTMTPSPGVCSSGTSTPLQQQLKSLRQKQVTFLDNLHALEFLLDQLPTMCARTQDAHNHKQHNLSNNDLTQLYTTPQGADEYAQTCPIATIHLVQALVCTHVSTAAAASQHKFVNTHHDHLKHKSDDQVQVADILLTSDGNFFFSTSRPTTATATTTTTGANTHTSGSGLDTPTGAGLHTNTPTSAAHSKHTSSSHTHPLTHTHTNAADPLCCGVRLYVFATGSSTVGVGKYRKRESLGVYATPAERVLYADMRTLCDMSASSSVFASSNNNNSHSPVPAGYAQTPTPTPTPTPVLTGAQQRFSPRAKDHLSAGSSGGSGLSSTLSSSSPFFGANTPTLLAASNSAGHTQTHTPGLGPGLGPATPPQPSPNTHLAYYRELADGCVAAKVVVNMMVVVSARTHQFVDMSLLAECSEATGGVCLLVYSNNNNINNSNDQVYRDKSKDTMDCEQTRVYREVVNVLTAPYVSDVVMKVRSAVVTCLRAITVLTTTVPHCCRSVRTTPCV